ncbi:MAG: hypothetical protein P8Y58_00740 [Novosphingobium sp.]
MNLRKGDYVPGPSPDPQDTVEEANAAVVLIDDSQFEIILQVPPFEAELFKEGQRALVANRSKTIARAVRTGNMSDVLQGVVWSVSPAISLQRRSVSVKVRVTARGGHIRDGSYVTAWVATAGEPAALTVPYRAIDMTGNTGSVFVLDETGHSVERREIKLGLLGLEAAQVIGGLAAGEVIVVKGQHRLSDGARVSVITDDSRPASSPGTAGGR